MIDLHVHTKYSDGTDDEIEILKKAEEMDLTYIAITDHNNCKVYDKLSQFDISKYFSGNIISGVELNTKVLGIPIEILGYGVNPDIINELTSKIYLTAEERNKLEMKRIYEKCVEKNIDLGENFVENYDAKMYTSKYFHKIITQKEENRKFISDEDAWNDSNVFYRKYMSNPESLFFVDTNDILPDFKKASDIIRKAGGLVFIPHIHEYRDNSTKILDYILENYEFDGIECYYTTFSDEQTEKLVELCKKRNLFISGGSDYHGANKPNVKMAIGKGDLRIPIDIIKDWINKIELYYAKN